MRDPGTLKTNLEKILKLLTSSDPHPPKTQNQKNISFIVFSLANVSKMNVLRVLGSKNLIKPIKNIVF